MGDSTTGPTFDAAACGVAALSLLEALILTLQERGLLAEHEVDEAFNAAIDAHRGREGKADGHANEAAARLLERLRVHGNAVRLDG